MKPVILYHAVPLFTHLLQAVDLPYKAEGALGGAVVLPETLAPPWTRDLADTDEPFVVLPSWLDVDEGLRKSAGIQDNPNAYVPAAQVTAMHRMLVRHELTHWIRAKKGYFEGLYKPSPLSLLQLAREEWWANFMSVKTPNVPLPLRVGMTVAIPMHIAGSVWVGMGGRKGVIWHASFGLIGSDPRDALREKIESFTEPPEDTRAWFEHRLLKVSKRTAELKAELEKEFEGETEWEKTLRYLDLDI
jgi:hypothetical protein